MIEKRFILRNEFIRKNVIGFIEKLPIDMEIIIRPWSEKRSITANARLWLLHTVAADHLGCTKEDVHEDMLCMVTGVKAEVRLPSGNLKRIPNKRSSDMGKKEFGEFMEHVEAFYIRELGVWLDQEAA